MPVAAIMDPIVGWEKPHKEGEGTRMWEVRTQVLLPQPGSWLSEGEIPRPFPSPLLKCSPPECRQRSRPHTPKRK